MITNFTPKFQIIRIMAEKKIEKKSYGVFQDALFHKGDDGSYKPLEMAKEGMTTLKKHSTQLTVVCTESSVEDIEDLLKKNEIPYDKVVKIDEKMDYIVAGKDNSFSVYSWTGVLDNIGYRLSQEQKVEKKSDQKKTDSALENWFRRESEASGCICRD